MAVAADAQSLGSTLAAILKEEPSVLFAGAGVSARAGLPIWNSFLEYLAGVVEPREAMIAGLMRKRIAEGSLLLAAQYYKTCTELTKGERFALLAEPFRSGKYNSEQIKSLVALPFASIVTTNYDRSLHDAYASVHGTAALQVELGDHTLETAFFTTERFIARIHGRAEVPETMVLDAADYQDVYKDAAYNDFLHSLLMQRRCIFIGFSFMDPAISRILDFIAARGVYPKKHFAFLPIDARTLTERMSNQNIELVLYDVTDHHRTLWDGIAYAYSGSSCGAQVASVSLPSSFDVARRLLAVCYARARMGDEATALSNIVVQGIVLSEISSGVTSIAELSKCLQKYIALKPDEAASLSASAVNLLAERGICMSDGADVVMVNALSDFVQDAPAPKIAQALVNRLMVREQYDVKPEIRVALERIAEEVIVLRGFDLGAEFSGARFNTDIDPSTTIEKTIDRHLPQYWRDRKSQIASAFIDLIRRPTADEEELLAEVGRISFGIEMVLQAGRATMYASSLPEVVYLDASVLLPAIVRGHPYQRAYIQALSKLQQATEAAGSSTSVMIADVFLNEIVSHRKNAIAIATELNLEDYDVLTRRIQYYGADNVNVFIGAYSTWLTCRQGGSFKEFLELEAPYETEEELAEFLKAKSIRVASTRVSSQPAVTEYEFIKERLLDGYDRNEYGVEYFDRKALILKKHEAAQIAALLSVINSGRRAVLVTADKQLRRVVAGLGIRQLRDALISHRNLVQLVDLLIGIEVDRSSLSRLLWTVRIIDERAAIKDYLIARALTQYDAALSLKMSDLIDGIVDRVVREAVQEGVKVGATNFAERAKETRFLDRVEADVFAELAEEVKMLKKKLMQRDK